MATAAAASKPKGRRLWGVPLPVIFFFFGMMLPTSVGVSAGGLRLSVYRVVLIIMFLPMLLALVTGKRGKMNIFDFLLFFHSFWAAVALIKWGGFAQGIKSGGIYIIEFAGSFMLGRLYIRSYEDFSAFAHAYVGVTVGLLLFTIPEALTSIHILHDFFAGAVGGPRAPYIDQRMGLERAFGPFDHPILYGVFSAAAFSCAYFVVAQRQLLNIKGMLQVLGVVVATFISASGGPYVVLMMQMFAAGWERLFAGIKIRWRIMFGLFALVYLWIDLMSSRTPFHVFVTYFTFSTQSAYNRINIWNYGTAEVGRNPIFGIGLGDWIRAPWMSDSMDNFWLLTAVRYGLPALIALLGLMLGMVYMIAQKQNLPQEWRNARHAWAFTLYGITIAAATVHLWNALFVLFMFLMGSGMWLYDTNPTQAVDKKGRVRPKGPAPAPVQRPNYGTLF